MIPELFAMGVGFALISVLGLISNSLYFIKFNKSVRISIKSASGIP